MLVAIVRHDGRYGLARTLPVTDPGDGVAVMRQMTVTMRRLVTMPGQTMATLPTDGVPSGVETCQVISWEQGRGELMAFRAMHAQWVRPPAPLTYDECGHSMHAKVRITGHLRRHGSPARCFLGHLDPDAAMLPPDQRDGRW
jgi:hypothetical protein